MTEDFVPRKVQIGDEEVKIERFRGLKAAEAGALWSRVTTEVPDLQTKAAEFRERFRQQNTIHISPAMAKLSQFAPLGLTVEDFAGKEYIEFPDEPDARSVVLAVWPYVWEVARRELERFLGLLVISNRDLEKADDEDNVDGALTAEGKRILRQGYVEECLELVVVGVEVFQDQLRRKRDSLGKLNIPFLENLFKEREEIPDETAETNGHGSMTSEEPPPEPSSAPVSSPDSESDGVDETSFTESLGTSSSS